jgi:hypothetical protein
VLLAGIRICAGVGSFFCARTGGKYTFPHSLLGELTARHLRTVWQMILKFKDEKMQMQLFMLF